MATCPECSRPLLRIDESWLCQSCSATYFDKELRPVERTVPGILTKEQRANIRFDAENSGAYSVYQWLLQALDTCDALERELVSAKATIEVLEDNDLVRGIAASMEDIQFGRLKPMDEVLGRGEERQRLRDAVIETAGKIYHWYDYDDGGMVVSGEAVHKLWDTLIALEAFEKQEATT
jgi:hypothetical protein